MNYRPVPNPQRQCEVPSQMWRDIDARTSAIASSAKPCASSHRHNITVEPQCLHLETAFVEAPQLHAGKPRCKIAALFHFIHPPFSVCTLLSLATNTSLYTRQIWWPLYKWPQSNEQSMTKGHLPLPFLRKQKNIENNFIPITSIEG